MKHFLALTLSLYTLPAFALAPMEGVYKLTGKNRPGEVKAYTGKVAIEKVAGDVYRLAWFIGNTQAQRGVAILENDVLSVSYVDMSGQDFGAVSYRLKSDKKLEGKWTTIVSDGSYGTELLEFESALPEKREKPTEKASKNKPLI